MNSTDFESVKLAVNRHATDPKVAAAIFKELEEEMKALEEEKAARPPALKKQLSIVISDPEGELTKKDWVGWVVQIPLDDDVATVPSRIHKAAHEFNTTPKGIRMPVESIGEACEAVTAKFFKEQAIWIKSKTPLRVISTPNQIPTDQGE